MFPALSSAQQQQQQHHNTNAHPADQKYMTNKAAKIKEAAKSASEQVKAQAEHIYQAYSVKNWSRSVTFECALVDTRVLGISDQIAKMTRTSEFLKFTCNQLQIVSLPHKTHTNKYIANQPKQFQKPYYLIINNISQFIDSLCESDSKAFSLFARFNPKLYVLKYKKLI